MSDAAERAILGAILFAPRLLSHCRGLLPSDFAHPYRAAVYGQLVQAAERNEPIDCILIEARLTAARVPKPKSYNTHFVPLSTFVDVALKEGTVDDAVIPFYAKIVMAAATRRRMSLVGVA